MSKRTYAPSPSTFAEDPDRYRKNGLHPLTIGETLKDGRYRIIHKLGSGSFATVWLARDSSENKYVSLKVLSAETPPSECKELRLLEAITESTVTHEGREFVQLLDHFIIDGPNGKHWCLVTAVAGDRLARKAGLPHNSLEWPRLISLQTEEEVYDCMGQPNKHPVRRLDGGPRGDNAPEYTVDPGDVVALERRLPTDRILLIDFGAAFYHGEHLDHIYTPAPHAAPEIVFGGELTHEVDKWAFGCLLYELCADHTLVKLLFGWNNDALKDQVAMLGKPPETLWQNWGARDMYFHPDGTPKEAEGRRLKVKPLSLEQRVRNLERPLSERGYDTGDPEPLSPDLQNLFDLLKGVITYDAKARLSFDQIQTHPFFHGVTIPGI
ncbi:kinase domain-containing protein [Lentithecium fluviatile CBS 122367]|uniref:non-specific serine/threonine protein kinase n=1 Tax=Lentithecium fluviatile CBS 122367 TaxID=1168545 RepID=A0A6G1JCD0_9PLEO|nr:kinase domain-containing protein [Lentithecium fluviatile CBS 122367]